MISSSTVACFIACLIACALSVNVLSAALSFTPDTAFLVLTPDEALEGSLNTTNTIITLREGYCSSLQVDTTTAKTNDATITLTIPSKLIKTVPLPMFYTLAIDSTSQPSKSSLSPLASMAVSCTNQDIVPVPASTPRYCYPRRVNQKSATFVIASEDDIAHIAAQKCTHVAGPLVIANLSLQPNRYIAGLGLLQTIEGALLITNNTGLLLDHFVGLKSVNMKPAGENTAMAALAVQYVPYNVSTSIGLAIINNTRLQDSTDVSAFLSIAHGFVLFTGNGGGCVTLDSPVVDPGRAYIELDAPSTCQCAFTMVPATPSRCVSWLPAQIDVHCAGGTIAHDADVAPYLTQACTVLTSGLFIAGPVQSEARLYTAFQYVHTIVGSLHVCDTTGLVGLEMLKNLVTVDSVVIMNNMDLFDARLPNLQPSTRVFVQNNTQLCDSGLPFETAGCGNMTLNFHFELFWNSNVFGGKRNFYPIINDNVVSVVISKLKAISKGPFDVSAFHFQLLAMNSGFYVFPSLISIDITFLFTSSADSLKLLSTVSDPDIANDLVESINSRLIFCSYYTDRALTVRRSGHSNLVELDFPAYACIGSECKSNTLNGYQMDDASNDSNDNDSSSTYFRQFEISALTNIEQTLHTVDGLNNRVDNSAVTLAALSLFKPSVVIGPSIPTCNYMQLADCIDDTKQTVISNKLKSVSYEQLQTSLVYGIPIPIPPVLGFESISTTNSVLMQWDVPADGSVFLVDS